MIDLHDPVVDIQKTPQWKSINTPADETFNDLERDPVPRLKAR